MGNCLPEVLLDMTCERSTQFMRTSGRIPWEICELQRSALGSVFCPAGVMRRTEGKEMEALGEEGLLTPVLEAQTGK